MEKTHKLTLYNDEHNNYLYVMSCLVKYCDHAREQAEQCAVITHNVGKCDIKHGSFLDMFELKSELDQLDLKVELEEYAGNLHQ